MAETAKAILARARARLKEQDVDGGGLDARLLLERAAGISHEALVADPDMAIDQAAAERFESLLKRRLAREPISRILSEREFYGRTFTVTPDVLDPRPDTETLIAAALSRLRPGARILDLGAGSGAIIVTLLAEQPGITGVAADLSPAALDVTLSNAKRHGVADRLALVEGNWFQRVQGQFDLIVSNPPYIPAADIAGLEPEVRNHDPHLALIGGADGLDAYRDIVQGASNHLAPEGWVIVEIGAGQAEKVASIFAAQGFTCKSRARDLGGHIRTLAFAPG